MELKYEQLKKDIVYEESQLDIVLAKIKEI